jgi:hypothetical protein
MKRWSAALLLALCACVRSNDPPAGSQTHFLDSCDASCPSPYDCLCGVCTLACTSDGPCAAEQSDAACMSARGQRSECAVAAQICDVECTAAGDCASLGEGFACSAGRCRIPDDATNTDAGAAGAAGSSSGAGAGGTAGASGGSADAGAGDDGGAPSADVLCDGSDDMRLSLTISGGLVFQSYQFTNPFGSRFLFVDGHCRYYASGDYLQGNVSGTLSADQAEQLAEAIGWSMIESWSAVSESPNCADGGYTALVKPGFETGCVCFCDAATAPPGKAAAIARVPVWIDMLVEQGTPLLASVSALANEFDPAGAATRPWPLDRAMAEIELLIREPGELPGARFDDASEAQQLRDLRAQMQTGLLLVTDAGSDYVLYVRDDLPDDVAAAASALRAGSMP